VRYCFGGRGGHFTVLVQKGANAQQRQIDAELHAATLVGQGFETYDVQGDTNSRKPARSANHEEFEASCKVRYQK
jgi:hypothetical protein